jgi:preprotein translocase subunit SecY
MLLESLRSPGGAAIVPNPGIGFKLLTVLTLTTGTVFIMWLGEQISERGIGNGISLIIFAGIVVDFPRAMQSVVSQIRTGDMGPLKLIFILAIRVAVCASIGAYPSLMQRGLSAERSMEGRAHIFLCE